MWLQRPRCWPQWCCSAGWLNAARLQPGSELGPAGSTSAAALGSGSTEEPRDRDKKTDRQRKTVVIGGQRERERGNRKTEKVSSVLTNYGVSVVSAVEFSHQYSWKVTIPLQDITKRFVPHSVLTCWLGICHH